MAHINGSDFKRTQALQPWLTVASFLPDVLLATFYLKMSLSLPALHYPPCASSSRAALRKTSPSLHRFKGLWQLPSSHNARSRGLSHFQRTCNIVPLAANMDAGQSDGPGKLDFNRYLEVAKNQWESLPQPIKNFPWTKALTSFALIILKLTSEVIKSLFVPWFAVSSLSEMSYCAQERKMILIPIPLLAGFAVAGMLNDIASELYPNLEEEEFPLHLLVMAVFFTLLKLPGPYYPYWLRIFVPHFANGGLCRTLWSAFMFYMRTLGSFEDRPWSTDVSNSEETKL